MKRSLIRSLVLNVFTNTWFYYIICMPVILKEIIYSNFLPEGVFQDVRL